ncbi:septum site-determining protein MinC [Paenibacillus endoradicis]|uniref:septum site-determining protein MinC n=1 Tax=Paenibacillus endoradicis TaxID=2972487 RepID=UPI002159AB76|nr:septum site-determining protein MinC [Paenibacillus endoradicis]MCR8655707.1 septum site-determining protein MinC [Paenibacillus endoradicis]MCR8658033.1 septum site-determining protein MinC [Paenibacillus endoradicis]
MTEKQHIMIKGVKDGLLFLLDDKCEFGVLVSELKNKIEKTHQQLLSGPLIHITVKLGRRIITEEQTKLISDIIRSQGNLMIQAIESDIPAEEKNKAHAELKVMATIVRSGQVIEFDGDLLLLGDVHPGGVVRCSGDIYILGSLKGQACAGANGREDAIIVASYLKPTQLKIHEIISKPFEEWEETDGLMEYAYIQDDAMVIQKLTLLHRENRLPIMMRGV